MLNPFSSRKAIRQVEPARAWIRRMPSPPRGKGSKSVSMTIDVVRADGTHYHVQDRWMVPGDEPISVGSELQVLIDRDDRERIAIDWGATREVHQAKMEEQRRLLPLGVPVPAGKLTRQAETAGLLQQDPDPRSETAEHRDPTPAEEAAGVARPVTMPPSAPTPALGGVARPPEPGQAAAPAKPLVVGVPRPRGAARRSVPAKAKPTVVEPRPADDELIERLERLSALHSAGELTDEEFAAVKRHLIS